MFFLEAPDEDMAGFRRTWDMLGEEITVEGEDGLWNCHIHTDDIGTVMEAGIEAGKPRRIRVRDLREQEGELEADLAAGGFSPLPHALAARIGVVAVAEGPGLVERFRRAGVQQVVTGGRPNGPGLDDILAAVEEASADVVVVLPNANNTVPVAEQVNGLTTKTVAVVPTRSVIQGLAALMGYVAEATNLDELLEDMAAAAGAIDFGEVARATRDATVDGWKVGAGDWLGVADGRVVVADPDRFAALRGLTAAILPSQPGRLTIFTGEGAFRADIKALEAWVTETHPGVEVSVENGGQKAHPYLLAVE